MQGLLAVSQVAIEERRRRPRGFAWRGGRPLRAALAEEQGQQIVALVRSRLQPLVEPRRLLAAGYRLNRDLLFLDDVMDVHEGGRIADVPVRLFVLLLEHFEDAHVAADRLVGAPGDEVDDPGLALLAVAVDPAVALLEHHERPRHVEVDQAVALVVQVDAFGRHVRAEQQAHRTLRVAEVLHHPLLFDIAHAAVEDLDLVAARLRPQIPPEAVVQPAQGLYSLGEDDETVGRGLRLPAERRPSLDCREQRPVLGVVVRADTGQSRAQVLERSDLGGDSLVRLMFQFPAAARDAVVDGLNASGRAGEERLLQRHDEEVPASRSRAVRHPHRQQGFVGRLLGRGRVERAPVRHPVPKRLADLILDVLLEPANHEALVPEVLPGVVVGIRDGGRVQHVHQAGEAPRLAVVGCRGEHDQRVGAPRQQSRETAAQRARAAIGHVVRLVDHDHVPPGLFEVGAVLRSLLQRVDGDDRLVVVVERVVVGRDAPPHPLDSDRVEPGQGNREPVPELFLELGEHALDGQHQDAPAAPPRDQFADQDAGLQRLAEAHRVGDQDALPWPRERLASRVELVLNEVHGGLMADADAVVVGYGRA